MTTPATQVTEAAVTRATVAEARVRSLEATIRAALPYTERQPTMHVGCTHAWCILRRGLNAGDGVSNPTPPEDEPAPTT